MHLEKNCPWNGAARVIAVRQALDGARAETGKFVSGFSAAQKTGLKENAAKLMKAESELGEQEKVLDARAEVGRIAGGGEGLRKALGNFRGEQDIVWRSRWGLA